MGTINSRAFGAKIERTILVEKKFKKADWYFLALNVGVLSAGIRVNLFGGMGLFIRF